MSELMLKSVYDLLGKNYFIPSYQRGYRWEEKQVKDLLDDLYRFACDKRKTDGAFYCLQPIVVKKCDKKTISDNNLSSQLDDNIWYEVIDGQQRLTTLYILFKYLIKANNIDVANDYGKDLYKIEYQTQLTKKSVVENPDVPDFSSPNAFYITEAYKNTCAWFNNFEKPKAIRNTIETLLFPDAGDDNNTGYVQVIWYESEDDDPISIFTRLNIGKIPLSNAELIKALFLQKRDNSELSKIQQIQIAKEWDQIEVALQDRRMWAFLNEGFPDIPAHIEFIFNTIFSMECENDTQKDGADEYATFRFFSEKFENIDRAEIEEQWGKVREYYETFKEWYSTPVWYHYIGFLIYCKEPIINIYKQYKGKTKKEFINSLVEMIKAKLNVVLTASGDLERGNKKSREVGSPVVYDEKNKVLLRQLLLLYNIEYIVQQNKDSQKCYLIFPFDLFKNEKWDIEHVDSFTTNPLTDKEQQNEWMRIALGDLKSVGIDYKNTEKITDEKRIAIDDFLERRKTALPFEEVKRIVSVLADEEDMQKENSADEKNSIGNLVLLNAKINRSYGNAIFPTKRKDIIEHDNNGTFIPLCTKKVFLKNFVNSGLGTIAWRLDDMKSYKDDIIDVIKPFLTVKTEEVE